MGVQRVRFKDIKDSFWERDQIEPAWQKCQSAWKQMIQRLQGFGVLSGEPLPTQAALVTLVSLLDRFPDEAGFDAAFYWFIQASGFGRYSGSGTTTLEEDLKSISSSAKFHEAIGNLLVPLSPMASVRSEDFLNDYSDGKFWRFLLYLLVYQNEAQDWSKAGALLGFDGKEVLADFTPQWHHIYPQKFLHKKVDEDKIQSLANIAVIGPSINIRISAQDPMKYLDKYSISDEKLRQQFVDMNRLDFTLEKFPEFLEKRAARLATEANAFLLKLSKSLA